VLEDGISTFILTSGSPSLVLRPGTADEVVAAVAFARANREVPLSVRSGGHGISGRSTNDGGIVIDLKRLNAIEVLNQSTRRVRIGPGARWVDVASALEPHGWAITSGDYGGGGRRARDRWRLRMVLARARPHDRPSPCRRDRAR
jgi:FAD/FMN-containing dehydrogenase